MFLDTFFIWRYGLFRLGLPISGRHFSLGPEGFLARGAGASFNGKLTFPRKTHPGSPGLHSCFRLSQNVSLKYRHSQLMLLNIIIPAHNPRKRALHGTPNHVFVPLYYI
ncbi:MAG: hypothetical protein IK012_08650 [Fibrobacter sp.]|uniref:hypothetical protein n=1 Tax=Fibrobacter sp. TaxID=35828 RepID=UPI0025BD8A31|nr:hypothetical protein [Fibrobacter sp.]MBR4785305.1 hypothetical protein [Fibrobacter sp.]